MVANIENYLFRWAVCEPDEEKCKDCEETECIYYEEGLKNESDC